MWGNSGHGQPGRHPPKFSINLLLVALSLAQGQALITPDDFVSLSSLFASFLLNFKQDREFFKIVKNPISLSPTLL